MSVTDEVRAERQRQRSRWGAKHDRGHSWWDWRGFMALRLRLVEPQVQSTERRRALIELASIAIAAIEANEARAALAPGEPADVCGTCGGKGRAFGTCEFNVLPHPCKDAGSCPDCAPGEEKE